MRTTTACLLTAAALAGCKGGSPEGVTETLLKDPTRYHETHGYVQMVPGVHIPSPRSDVDLVEVWLTVPDDGLIDAVDGPDGKPILDFPPGTIADRVEFRGLGAKRRVVDVRGTIVGPDNTQTFHVMKPTAGTPEADLFVLSWAREDTAAHERATARLKERLADVSPIKDWEDTKRDAYIKSLGQKNACLPCHTPDRPQNKTQGQHGLVNRGTDHSGFFTPTTVLLDEIPLEPYGGHDLSLTDPAIEIVCGEGAQRDGRTCDDGQVPLGKWSFVRAWELNPERARQVCAARRYLVEHMAPAARSRFAESLTPCNQGQETD